MQLRLFLNSKSQLLPLHNCPILPTPESVSPLNNFLLSPRRLTVKNIAFSSSSQPLTIDQRSECIKYSFRGCLPSKSSGSLTAFLTFRSAFYSDDFARGQKSFSPRNGFSHGVENTAGLKVSASDRRRKGLAVFPCLKKGEKSWERGCVPARLYYLDRK